MRGLYTNTPCGRGFEVFVSELLKIYSDGFVKPLRCGTYCHSGKVSTFGLLLQTKLFQVLFNAF